MKRKELADLIEAGRQHGQAQVYVLTMEVNDYDQHGEYFIAVFGGLPSLQQLAEFFAKNGGLDWKADADIMEAVAFLEHLRKGGGRRGVEDRWYNLQAQPLL